MMDDLKQIRETAKIFHKLADTYNEVADLMENEELSKEELESKIELLLGKIMMLSLKVDSIL